MKVWIQRPKSTEKSMKKLRRIQILLVYSSVAQEEKDFKLSFPIMICILLYINYLYRSLKCIRDGDIEAARLEAAFSIPSLLDVNFAIHKGRLRPYYKYLKWELKSFPLTKFPMTGQEIVSNLMKILINADYKVQQKFLIISEQILRQEGFDHVFDSWGDDFLWMKNFIPENE